MGFRRKKKKGPTGVIESVRPYADNVGAKAGPLVDQAAERVGPAVEQAQHRVSDAMSNAAVVSEPYRKEASRRGRAAVVALRGGDPRAELLRRRRRTRKVLVFGGLTALALGAGVAYWMSRTAPPSPWQPEAGNGDTTASGSEPGAEATAPEATGAEATGPGATGAGETGESGERSEQAGRKSEQATRPGSSTDGTRMGSQSGTTSSTGTKGSSSSTGTKGSTGSGKDSSAGTVAGTR